MFSILCVTKMEPHAAPFLERMAQACRLGGNAQLVIALDGDDALAPRLSHPYTTIRVHSAGYIESVLDQALTACVGDYVLRLDDDEAPSVAMLGWLSEHRYLEHPHWKFPRVHLIKNETTVLLTPQLWPDHQTRMSQRGLAGRRSHIHAGSPFGGGHLADCAIEHHKFLVKTYEQRCEIADRYDRIQPGAGRAGGMAAFQVPEDAYDGQTVVFGHLGTGHGYPVVQWEGVL